MKKIYLFLSLTIMAYMGASCSLEETAYQADESYVKDADVAELLLQGVYKQLGSDGIYRHNLPFIFNLTTDEAKPEGSSLTAQRTEGCNAFTATSSYVQQTWQALYAAIYDANYFLEMMGRKMPEFTEDDQKKCELFIAEAKALRALLYFELVRWFGNVPLVLNTADSYKSAHEHKQADPTAVYEQIEKDLKDAIGILPYADEDNVRRSNSFRISKGGALGLLAKVYATWAGYPVLDESKWEDAANTAKQLVESGKHGLLPSFDTLWVNSASNKWDPKESLIELSYWSPLSTTESCGRVGNVNGVRVTQGALESGNHGHNVFYYLNPPFFTSWKDYEKDLRFGISYADYNYTKDGKKKYCIKTIDGVKNQQVSFLMAWLWKDQHKDWRENWRFEYSYRLTNGKWDTEIYVPASNYQVDNNYTNINWYVLRYADVLLLYAEALNEFNNGPTAEAYEALNMVRRRGFGQDVNTPSADADVSGLDYAGFRKAVRDERGWEMVGEGHRRQDLVRWGIYYETVMETYVAYSAWYSTGQKYYLGGEYTIKGKHELLPIPQREVDLCGYKQNPGWN